MKVWAYVMYNDYSRSYAEDEVADREEGERVVDALSRDYNWALNMGAIKDYQVELRP